MFSYIRNGWREARGAIVLSDVTQELAFYEGERPEAQSVFWSAFDRFYRLKPDELLELFDIGGGLQKNTKKKNGGAKVSIGEARSGFAQRPPTPPGGLRLCASTREARQWPAR